jgi:glycine hydroxymethyltransferase
MNFNDNYQNDEELYSIIKLEFKRQKHSLELIASENYTPNSVLQCLGSVLTNKYSEGQPFRRYYGGNQFIDQIETLCQKRALEAFRLDSKNWSVNVQPYSGSPANFAVLTGLLKPHDKIMGLDLPSGGHLTHGFFIKDKKISATSLYFESHPYQINQETELIDYDALQEKAKQVKPKLIICGHSGYPRDLDYKKFRQIADSVNAYLMADMAHISGLVATEQHNNPFEYCDIVTSTTHKTLRGPRSGIIFVNKNTKDYEGNDKYGQVAKQIDEAIFPGLQGGPHQHQIGALCHQLKVVNTSEFKEYIKQVKNNSKVLANRLQELGYHIVSGGTDNHLVMVNVKKTYGVTGSKVEKICEELGISINKNALLGDPSPLSPSGIRLGTPAMTTRGFNETDFVKTANYIDTAVKMAKQIQEKYGKKLVDFNKGLEQYSKTDEFQKVVKEIYDWVGSFEFYHQI